MSYNIWMDENKFAHMMYVGELPWHELGQKLDEPATSKEAIQAAGLDWNVVKVPLVAVTPEHAIPVPEQYALVPEDRMKNCGCPVFGVVGKEYQILQNREAFEFFEQIVGTNKPIFHTAGALGQGERIWTLARLGDAMQIVKGDTCDKYVLFSTGHDGQSPVRIMLTAVRVVCQNTLTLALETGDEIMRAAHTRNMKDKLEQAAEILRQIYAKYQDMETTCRKMTEIPMTEDQTIQYYEEVICECPTKDEADRPPPKWITTDRTGCLESYKNGPGAKLEGVSGTLWGTYNGITHYYDHSRAYPKGALNSLLFGRAHTIKNRAYTVAAKRVAESK